MARLFKRKRGGKVEWYVLYHDHARRIEDNRVWVSCSRQGAVNDPQRRELLRRCERLERKTQRDVEDLGGALPRYNVPLSELAARYLEEVDARACVRSEGRHGGLAPLTAREYRRAVELLLEFVGDIRAGSLDGETVRRFKVHLETTPGPKGVRSPHTVNKILRGLRAFLYHFGDASPPYFRDLPERLFRRALSSVSADRPLPEVLSDGDIHALLAAAMEMDGMSCRITREAKQAGKSFEGSMPAKYLPTFPLIALLALTGARTHEVLGLTWDAVDLEAGIVRFRSRKTGRDRLVPLVGDASGDVSPGLLTLLRLWAARAGGSSHVLPCLDSEAPRFSQHAWERIARKAGVPKAKPKALRSTWVSFLCSLGRPVQLIAWWAGHSPAVLHKHYADYTRGRQAGRSLDEAMGIADLLATAAREYTPGQDSGTWPARARRQAGM